MIAARSHALMMRNNHNYRLIKCMLVLTPAIILLASTVAAQNLFIPFVRGQPVAETAGSMNETGTPSSVEPLLIITSPSNSSQIPAGEVLVSGNASDTDVANIQTIGVKIDDDDYIPATPQAPDDWSDWSITLDIAAPGPHTLKARADYGAGEQTWSIGNILVNVVSDAEAASNATSGLPISGGNVSQQSSIETSNESASENQMSQIPPQPPSSQQEAGAGSPEDQEVKDSSTDNQEVQDTSATYRNPLDILFGRG
jgi:hypothetical protein